MVKHIVFWKLKDNAEGRDRNANALLIKQTLESLQGKIPGLLRIEVGFDFIQAPTSCDVALYSELESPAALDAYQSHPAHQAVLPLIRAVVSERHAVDYEV